MGNKNRYKSKSLFDMQFITSSISTTLVLLLLGLVVFFVLTAHNMSVYVRENISFSVLISDDMKEADILPKGYSVLLITAACVPMNILHFVRYANEHCKD